jgi:hypothetical protein
MNLSGSRRRRLRCAGEYLVRDYSLAWQEAFRKRGVALALQHLFAGVDPLARVGWAPSAATAVQPI